MEVSLSQVRILFSAATAALHLATGAFVFLRIQAKNYIYRLNHQKYVQRFDGLFHAYISENQKYIVD